MPVCAMPAYFLAHSAMEGRGGFAGREKMAGRVRGRAGFLSVSVAVLMGGTVRRCFPLGKGE